MLCSHTLHWWLTTVTANIISFHHHISRDCESVSIHFTCLGRNSNNLGFLFLGGCVRSSSLSRSLPSSFYVLLESNEKEPTFHLVSFSLFGFCCCCCVLFLSRSKKMMQVETQQTRQDLSTEQQQQQQHTVENQEMEVCLDSSLSICRFLRYDTN